MTGAITRAFLVWLLMMATESVHGLLRTFFLAPYVGDFRARQIGVVAGSAIILALVYLFIEWIGAKDTGALWTVGLMWFAMTLAFEFILGRFAFGYPSVRTARCTAGTLVRWGHSLMERKQLLGIAARVEAYGQT